MNISALDLLQRLLIDLFFFSFWRCSLNSFSAAYENMDMVKGDWLITCGGHWTWAQGGDDMRSQQGRKSFYGPNTRAPVVNQTSQCYISASDASKPSSIECVWSFGEKKPLFWSGPCLIDLQLFNVSCVWISITSPFVVEGREGSSFTVINVVLPPVLRWQHSNRKRQEHCSSPVGN